MSAPRQAVFNDSNELAASVADQVVDLAKRSVERHGRFTVALAGGSTPRALYQLLASDSYRDQIPWESVHVFLGDERYVPLDHEDSNFRMVSEALLNYVAIPEEQIFPVSINLDPEMAAETYEATIRQVFDSPAPAVPAFDLILLGIGSDGHTASLFPETEALEVANRLVVENWVPQQNAMRITFTIPLLHHARSVILMAVGEDKAEAIARAIEAPRNLTETPSQCLRDAQGDVIMVLDHSAASSLTSQT